MIQLGSRKSESYDETPRTWRTSSYFYCTQASHNQILKPVQKNSRKNSSQRLHRKSRQKTSQASHNTATETSNLKANRAHTRTSHPRTQSSSVSHPHKTLKKERGGREERKERRSYSFTSFPEGDKQWSEKRQKDRRKLGP
jgi:hypothetical protein